ncbi:GATA transcription factor 26 [Musa troglodytarum]|uniref:GATA transcription factor 26 n=1 Tax=Musa troglodytarum TaxID=320322 RepID=A0A9E7F245_9LILI|nr:GATA transcription factor 26 [Musa troglodytarum]
MDENGGSFLEVRRISQGPDRGSVYHSTPGSTAWIGKGFSCVCAQGRESDARVSFDLTPSQEALWGLWYAAYPGIKLHDLISEQWKEMGWQGKDPSTDFRGGGFISLENLLFFARNYPKSFQDLLGKQDGDRALWEYPFAVAGVNITFMLIQMLDLQAGLYFTQLFYWFSPLTPLTDYFDNCSQTKVNHWSYFSEATLRCIIVVCSSRSKASSFPTFSFTGNSFSVGEDLLWLRPWNQDPSVTLEGKGRSCSSLKRWRTKGSLANYVPLHSRDSFNSDELKVSKIKSISSKSKEQKLQKNKQSKSTLENECEIQYYDQNFLKIVEGDVSNRSSSDSAISGSESCVHFGTTDASDITGSVQSNVEDSLVPSKKRTFTTRPKPSVEKLTKDLYSILHEEQSSNLSRISDDDLLYESGTPLGSFEIGYGGVLIRHPNSKSVEEESEASSFPVYKSCITNEDFSGSASLSVNTKSKKRNLNSGTDPTKSTAPVTQENPKRDLILNEKLNNLQNWKSCLSYADLNVFLNFEVFMKYLTYEEQQRLMKYLPSTDAANPPESLKSMFTSPQFLETLSYLQQLFQDGVLDLSLSGANAEECKTVERLALLNSTNLQWSEFYQDIKDSSSNKKRGNGKLSGQLLPEQKSSMRSPKRVCRSGGMNPPSGCSIQLESSVVSKATDDTEDFVDHEAACIYPRKNFATVADRSYLLAPKQFIADSSDDDLLLDMPSSASFPEAELLYHPWRQIINQNDSPAESGLEASYHHPSSSFCSK